MVPTLTGKNDASLTMLTQKSVSDNIIQRTILMNEDSMRYRKRKIMKYPAASTQAAGYFFFPRNRTCQALFLPLH